MAVVIETTLGDITIDLFVDERPTTCMNFLKLCKIKYYNFSLFHSVQQNFIAQSGDPSGSGHEGSSIFCQTRGKDAKYYEAEKLPKLKHSNIGTVSMVNCGNHMFGSQFFITLGKDLQSLDGEHCVFGEVAEGHEVLRKFNEVICDQDHRPYQDIRITHTVILEDPFDDPEGLQVPDRSPELTKEVLANSRIAPDEEIDETAGLTAEEIEELQRSREAKAQATILEIVGDLPDAEVAPPENVLFVCKLNPVTTDDDLEIIFSRFGKIVSCEVIRDKTTGDSLQYAFVEFENRKACEDAYFKMDNVLIDDRRIHVDFSQSVSKLRWKGKGRGVEHLDDGKPRPDYANYDRKSSNNAKRSPDNSRRRYAEGDSYSHRRNYPFSQRDSAETRPRKPTSRESSPQNRDSRERKRRSDQSNERYHRSYDYDNSYVRHRNYNEFNESQERSKHESHRENNSIRSKRDYSEKHYYKNERREIPQNREERRRRRSPESASDTDDNKGSTPRKKYDDQRYRKGSVDSENEIEKHDHGKQKRRAKRSPSSETDQEKVDYRKGSKHGRIKDRSGSTDTDNNDKSIYMREKFQKSKSKGDTVISTDESIQNRSSDKHDRQKSGDNNFESEDETAPGKKHEKRKSSDHGSDSDREQVSSHREEKRKHSASLGSTKKPSSRDEKGSKRKEKIKNSDSEIEKSRQRSEKRRSTSRKSDYDSGDDKVSLAKKNKVSKTKGNKNKNVEKKIIKTRYKKIPVRKDRKKGRHRSKKHESSSSSETSNSSSSSDSESDTSTSSSTSSSDSEDSSDSSSSSKKSSSSSSSCSSSSSSSSSSDNSRYDRKHKRRKKSARVSVVVKRAKKTTVPTKKTKKDLKRLSESSGGETRKSKGKGQKRKSTSTFSRNGDEDNKHSKSRVKSKKRKASSSVDSSDNSGSSDSSEESEKEKKRHKKPAKKIKIVKC